MAFVKPPKTPLEQLRRAIGVKPNRLLQELELVTGSTWNRAYLLRVRNGEHPGSAQLREALRVACSRLAGREVEMMEIFPPTEAPGRPRL